MSKRICITIARQYGSGGREIGELVAKELNIPIYDKELITEAASKENLNEEVIRNADESATNSLLYTVAMGSNSLGAAMHLGYKMPLNDKLFLLQSEVIRESAKKGSGVYIGRCADYVLREEPCVLRVFIHGDLAHREARVKERHPELKSSQIINVIEKTDKRRSTYYNFYTGNKWGHFENYDLLVNSSTLGIQGTAHLIADLAKKMLEK